MRQSKPVLIGAAWYRPEQWGLLRSLAVDAEKLEETYEEWLAIATKTVADMQSNGIAVRKVDVNVRELATWCQARGRALDAGARATFVSEKVELTGKRIQRRKLRRRKG
jgi:hypothetical protein